LSNAIATSPASSPPPPSRAPQAALGRHTALGFIWMLGQAVVTKGAGIIGQIVMARILLPHDFALVALTYSVSSFPNLIRDAGLQTILVQRQRHLRRWIGPVFWLSLVLGVAAAIIMAIAAPLAARVYAQPGLTGLLLVVAVGSIVGAAGTVPNALVQIHLRFRFQALLGLVFSILTLGLNVLLAYRGWGAYSFIVPLMLNNGLRSAVLWIAALPIRMPLRFQPRRWRWVFSDSGALLMAGVLGMAISQGDYLIVGLFHRHDDTVGIFFFAFNLSMQTLVFLTVNLGSVLFPALAKFQHDTPRQMQAYLRTAKALALVGIPLCFLQAALCDPGFHLVFKPTWYPAIHVTEVLSLAMAVRTVGMTWLTLTAAQGRFRMQLVLNFIFCILFLSSVAIGASLGGALLVATTEMVFFTLADSAGIIVVLRANGLSGFRELARIYTVPLLAGGFSVGAAFLLGRLLPVFDGVNLTRLALVTVISVGLYLPLVRRLAPSDWKELQAFRRSAAA
jgi:PST family polysaccharide transporter